MLAEKYREVDVRAALSVVNYHLMWVHWDLKDEDALRATMDRLQKADEETLKLRPDSPYLQLFLRTDYVDRAESLSRSGQLDRATPEFEKFVAHNRAMLKATPEGLRQQWLLADSLNSLGKQLRRKKRPADARAAHEECNQLMDALVRRAGDRSRFAAEWLRLRLDTAEYFQYGNPSGDQIQAEQNRLRTLDAISQRGREFAARFPDDATLQGQVAQGLHVRGRYDLDAQRYKEALPYLADATELYRSRVLAAQSPIQQSSVVEFISYAMDACTCAEKLKLSEAVVRLTNAAIDAGRSLQDSGGIENLGEMLLSTARIHAAGGRTLEAVKAYTEADRLYRPVFEKMPWHFYVRWNLGAVNNQLAELHHKLGDFKNEVLCAREYLKIWIGPMQGMNIEDYVNVAHAANEAEAARVREFLKKAPGMKRFTVPCDFAGVKYPVHLYVTEDYKAITDQFLWLERLRGGKPPAEVVASFTRLFKIAKENKVSFQDLCVYALGTAAAESGQTVKVTDEGGSAKSAARGTSSSPATVSQAAGPTKQGGGDPQAPLKARVVELKTKLDNAPSDLAILQETAGAYESLATSYLEGGDDIDSLKAFEPCLKIREMLARSNPLSVALREQLAKTYLAIGKLLVRRSEFDRAYVMYHRQMDVLETVIEESYAAVTAREAVTETQMLVAELCNAKGDQVEAFRWELKAMARGSSKAPRRIGGLLELRPDFAKLLSRNAQAALARTTELVKANKKAVFGEVFAMELDKENKARLAESNQNFARERDQKVALLGEAAEQFRSLAEGYAGGGKKEQALDMYRKEADLRAQQFAANANDPKLKEGQMKAALNAGRLAGELGHGEEAVRLLSKAQFLGSTEAILPLADVYEAGNGVKKDLDKARSLRLGFYFQRGSKASLEKRYGDAIADFDRSASFATLPQTIAQVQERLGLCHTYLGQWDEARACYAKAFETAPEDARAPSFVLNLLEATICAERPEEVLRFFESLDAKGWKRKVNSTNAILFDAISVGIRAMAMRLTGQNADALEQQLAEMLDRPNVRVTDWSWKEIDGWLAKTKLDAAKLDPVKKIIAVLRRRQKR